MSPSSVLDLESMELLRSYFFTGLKHKGVLHQMTLIGFLIIIIKLLNDACNTSKILIIYQKEQKKYQQITLLKFDRSSFIKSIWLIEGSSLSNIFKQPLTEFQQIKKSATVHLKINFIRYKLLLKFGKKKAHLNDKKC
ncbi:hypothetical protein BpHYR1_022647 [Brachionus plicatilis]|uniref:Uncharacterized protein n=1 Tax=Brachionus plicatilis TaxID=10195 RepID=A0A3M7SPA0_BRAPC|nr:hypothetical protein BpHYR1_022647 [Brachionus plicatilis]